MAVRIPDAPFFGTIFWRLYFSSPPSSWGDENWGGVGSPDRHHSPRHEQTLPWHVFNQVKYKKFTSKQKWNECEYHVLDNSDVYHLCVKISCNLTQFPALAFCGINNTPHVVHGLEKHYNRHFDPKLTQVICEVLRIPCSCIYCTSLLEKSWSPGVLHAEKPRYQLVLDWIYWTVLLSFKNGALLNSSIKLYPMKNLMIFIILSLVKSVLMWILCCKQVITVHLIQTIQK